MTERKRIPDTVALRKEGKPAETKRDAQVVMNEAENKKEGSAGGQIITGWVCAGERDPRMWTGDCRGPQGSLRPGLRQWENGAPLLASAFSVLELQKPRDRVLRHRKVWMQIGNETAIDIKL